MPLFDAYIMADWSAASARNLGKDSIWLGIARPGASTTVENIATRLEARGRLQALAAEALAQGHRLLIGFDFPFGYPTGVARHVTGHDNALTLWRWIAARFKDHADNRNNRFAVAEEINRLYPGTGPFWGRPAKWNHPDIPTTEKARTRTGHPPERRLADTRAKGAKTVWQLAYAGSVGSQVLTGLPHVLALRDDPELAPDTAIWPFETGLATPTAKIVLAEIYPSLIPPDLSETVKDAGQVRAVADWLSGLDRDNALEPMFAGPSDATVAQRSRIVAEEAWILGLDAPLLRSVGTAPKELPQAGALPASPVAPTPTAPAVAMDVNPNVARRTAVTAQASETAEEEPALHQVPTSARTARLRYERDPAQIYRQSFATVEAEARLDHIPDNLRPVAIRLVHACGMPDITARLAWSDDLANSARRALAAGAPILCDCEAVAAMVIRNRLPAANPVHCTLNAPETPGLAAEFANTRSAAALHLWQDHIAGSIVAIGNAPTALFHLLELLDQGWPRPAAILGLPVGFVGAAESKAELANNPRGTPFLTLRGRRGGSAMAAAAVNALAAP